MEQQDAVHNDSQQVYGCTSDALREAKKLTVEDLDTAQIRDTTYGGHAALLIPYFDQNSIRIADRFRIALNGRDCFRWAKGSTPTLYGQSSLRDARERGFVILVEGETDVLTLHHHGEPAVGIPGASTWRPEFIPLFDGIDRIYFVSEPDEASTRLLVKLAASELRDRIWVIELVGFKDVSELHCSDPEGFPEAWAKAKEAARHLPALDLDVSEPKPSVAALFEIIGSPSSASIEHVEMYREELRRVAKAHRSDLVGRWRLVHAELARCLRDVGIRKPDSVAKEMMAGLEDLPLPEEEPKGHAPGDPEIEAKAKTLLGFDNLLEFAVASMNRGGLLGEEINCRVLLLSAVGGLVGKPIHIVIKGDSSGGKNTLANAVLSLMPPGSVLAVTGMSTHALEYRGGLIQGVLLIDEAEGQKDAAYQIRIAMSEGRVSRLTVNRSEGGWLVAQELEVEVRASIITTTTAVALHPENETRLLDLHIDDSEELTRAVLDAVAKEAAEGTRKAERSRETRIWRAALRMLETLDVITPYLGQLSDAFPKKPVRVRRDFKKVLALIENCALLHQFTRERDDAGRVVASREDYAMVLPLIQAVLGPSMSGLSRRASAIYTLLTEMEKEVSLGVVRRIDLEREADKRGIASSGTVQKWVRHMIDLGFIEGHKGDRGWILESVRDPAQESIALPRPEDLILPSKEA